MVFSHDGSTSASTGVPGPSRSQPTHEARGATYLVPSLSSRSGTTSENKPPKRIVATEEQINAHLYNDYGSLRIAKDVGIALRASGLGAGTNRIAAQLRAVQGVQRLPGASDEQIKAHLYNDDESLRSEVGVAKALNSVGLGARNDRIRAELQLARAQQ
jgi:hypothetical protein